MQDMSWPRWFLFMSFPLALALFGFFYDRWERKKKRP